MIDLFSSLPQSASQAVMVAMDAWDRANPTDYDTWQEPYYISVFYSCLRVEKNYQCRQAVSGDRSRAL